MSHSFRDDPRFLITLLPALEVSRMQAMDTVLDLERQITEIKEVLSNPPGAQSGSQVGWRPLPQHQQPSQPQLGSVNGYSEPPIGLPSPPPPPPPPSISGGPTPDSQAGFVLTEARRHGGRIDTQAIILAATRSNNPMIRKLLTTQARGSAINNLVLRGFAVRGPERGSMILTPKGLGNSRPADRPAESPADRPQSRPMPANLRRALAKVASDDEATAATKKSTRVYQKGLPPKPDTQYGFILAAARRHGGTINTEQLIAAARHEKNPVVKKVAAPGPYSVARVALIKRGFLVKTAGAPGSVKLTPRGMEATDYVTGGSAKGHSKEPEPVKKHARKPVKHGIRYPGLTQAQYIARLALENGGTINNDQLRQAAARDSIYPKLANPDNLSVAVTLAIKGGYVTRTGPGVLEATKREKHQYEKQQQQQQRPDRETSERASETEQGAEASGS